jgi:hypothetical protein
MDVVEPWGERRQPASHAFAPRPSRMAAARGASNASFFHAELFIDAQACRGNCHLTRTGFLTEDHCKTIA